MTPEREDNFLLIGKQLGHYVVLSRLGSGGMGEIFLAEDTRLKRKVALKLLPAELTSNRDRLRRFEQEAIAASALNHPNIITIHEIGQLDNLNFIVTEFIEGQTLRQQMATARMDLPAVLDIAIEVASALSAAHRAGIVHRDLKPENIMLRPDGLTKVLDFGLAKLTEPRTSVTDSEAETVFRVDTEIGTVMGTVHYMSPEQTRGLKVDARSDIFSLGVVLYEILAGKLPFTGATSADVSAAILSREPSPISQHRPEAPKALEEILSKMLCKERERRYQTVEELLADLKRVKQRSDLELKRDVPVSGEPYSGATAALAPATDTARTERPTLSLQFLVAGIKNHKIGAMLALAALLTAAASIAHFATRQSPIDSIAVLPFINESKDPNTEMFSDGISDSIINQLTQLPNLRVVSLNSTLRYKGKEIDAQTIGQELKVRAVLVGRLLRQGDDLSISAELVDVGEIAASGAADMTTVDWPTSFEYRRK